MGRASGGYDTSLGVRYNVSDFLGAMSDMNGRESIVAWFTTKQNSRM